MTNTIAVHGTGKRFVCVAIFSTLFAFFTALTVQGAIIPRLKNGENLKIAAIGTSLTDATVLAPNWFAQTGTWLSETYPGQVTLSNRAVSGTMSENRPDIGRLHGGPWQLNQVLFYDNPDAIFIEFATNDAGKIGNISVTQSRNNLRSLITTIKTWATDHGKTVDIVVQTMNNLGPSVYYLDYNDPAPYYQAWREEAAANNVLLIDHYPNWLSLYNSQPDHADWRSYIPDNIHPTSLGATNVILPEVQRALTAQVPEPNSSIILGTAIMGLLCYAWRKRK